MNELQTIHFSLQTIPLQDLIAVQKRVYGNNRNPHEINLKYFRCGLLILQNSLPAGSICLYQNPAIDAGKTLLVGNLEFINDATVFERLMQEATTFSESNHFTAITGPINGSTWDNYRLPLNKFGTHFITDLPQPEYYAQFFLQSGFTIAQRYFTSLSAIVPKTTNATFIQQVEEAGIRVRPISLEQYETELEKLYALCATAFANNVLYSTIRKEDFIAKYRLVKPLLQAEFIWLAEDAAGALQAFILCLPDPYQKDRLVMKTIARNISNRHSAGLVRYLADIIYSKAYNAGFRHMLHAFMHSSNRSKVLSEKYSGKVFKEYALFTKNILP